MVAYRSRFIQKIEIDEEDSNQLELDFSVNIDAVEELSNPSNWIVDEAMENTVWGLYNKSANLNCVVVIDRAFHLDSVCKTTENYRIRFNSPKNNVLVSDERVALSLAIGIIKGE